MLGYLGKLNEKELAELHTRGYLPSDYLGKSGLEKEYEGVLRGKYGRKKLKLILGGREQNVLAEEAPAPGQNLVLSIDLEAQNKLEDLIKEMLRRTGKKKGGGFGFKSPDRCGAGHGELADFLTTMISPEASAPLNTSNIWLIRISRFLIGPSAAFTRPVPPLN